MAGFKFRLEQILRYRAQLEDQAKMALSSALAELTAQEQNLERLKNLLQQQEGIACLDPAEFWLRDNYIRSLKDDIEAAALKVETLKLKVERCRYELIKKSQERQLLQKLKEKQAERYANEQKLKEQSILDEIASHGCQIAAF